MHHPRLSIVLLSLVALALVLITAPPTDAQAPEEAAANLLYTDGKAAFDKGDFAQALTLFQQAFEVLQNDFIRFNLGRTHAALGQCDRALVHFGDLTTRLPSGPRELRRAAEVRCRLALGAAHLDGYRCHEALEVLKPIAQKLKAPESRRR
jgi:tetratricopeptide (TPR) repeat protein